MTPEAEREIRPGPTSAAQPLTSQMLDVGDGHALYVETSGNADGSPAIYLHGGPGSGCQPDHRRLFDTQRFRAVLFDQRGAGRSRPKGGRQANTLPHLIADMETIRTTLGIERWLVVGGSWGATLALAYAQAHPDRVSGIVLRATFLGTRAELETAFLETLPRFYPGLNADFLSLLREGERAAPLDAYWRRILDPDSAVHGPAARAWGETESILSQIAPKQTRLGPRAAGETRPLPATPFMEAHYFVHDCFMRPDQLIAEANKLAGIPGIVVQGRYDLLCPPATAHRLIASWPNAELRTVDAAGHLLYDPGVRDAVIAAINDIADRPQHPR
ncbi:proline iminopeptidase [Rhodopseudomonas sp. AAP120]|uniref:prolyl aminopeptidase n=1 Tax=Rhodopseudomonas sp. AAP120 TaxID=1523430 RepID=UPI0006B9B25E|nr:prolyl aminopeptidase [Rhodopseudomonas sp. AAP120]KPF96459.1 proline iminopeptidase [Rhodopseudomonas sp. AAP120]